jgi:hypothetical protein
MRASEFALTESQTAKTGIMQTDVYGSRAYHARCLEPGCDWESRRYDRIQQAQSAAKKHAATHFDKKAVAEGLDKNKINDVLNNIRSGKTFANLSTEDQIVLMTVIDEAKSKLLNLINSDNQIKTDWPHVKKFIDSNQSLISMMSWDAWFKLGIIKQNPNQNTASISNDEIIVNPNLYNVLQWRFIITWLQNRIQRNKLTKSDIDLIFKLKTLIDNNPGVAEGATVTRIDSKPVTDFASGLKAYKHTDDWSQSGLDTGDDSYWKNKNLKTNTTKGLFAGDPRRTALYATGNAHETRYVEFTQNGQPIVYFDQKDLPAMRSRKTYLTVFDASNFRQLPTGEWFSENPGKPIKQVPIGDPFKYIASQGWIVRVTDDLDKVFKQVQKMHKAGKIPYYGAEGMNESKQGVAENFADGRNPGRKGLAKRVGVDCKQPVSKLRSIAKNSSGERQRMAHWCANMKAGRKK